MDANPAQTGLEDILGSGVDDAPMDITELTTIIALEIEGSKDLDRTSYAEDRERALAYYLGRMHDTNPPPKRSKAMSRDVADTVDWILPGLMRVFFASDKIVEYLPARESDKEHVDQATDYINLLFNVKNDGYSVCWNAFWDALVMRSGIIKFWWDDVPEFETETFSGLDGENVQILANEPYVEIISQEPSEMLPAPPEEPEELEAPEQQGGGEPDPQAVQMIQQAMQSGMDPMQMLQQAQEMGMQPADMMSAAQAAGIPPEQIQQMAEQAGIDPAAMQPQEPAVEEAPPPPPEPEQLYDVVIRRQTRPGRVRIMSMPPEEFLIDSDATGVHDARFMCHWTTKTRSSLVEDGYDRDKVDEFPVTTLTSLQTPESIERQESFNQSYSSNMTSKAMERVEVFECYAKIDYNRDGVAEWMRVILAGGTGDDNVLAIEEWGDPIPFVDLVPYPIPHRRQGRSIADQTMDIQQIKTVLLRGTLDGVYENNNPQKVVVENEIINPDEVLNPQFNGVIRVRTNPQAVMPLQPNYIGDSSFQMMSYFDEMIEKRTGVSRMTMALDPETLQNQSATAANLQFNAAYSKQELIARNFAEGGLRDLFKGLLKLVVQHQDQVDIVRLRDHFVEMDPRSWNADMDAVINIGLGTGSSDRDLAVLQQVLQLQQAAMEKLGEDNPMIKPSHIANTMESMIKSAGLKSVDLFMADVSDEEWAEFAQKKAKAAQEAPQDPKAQAAQQKAQADIQIAQQKMQADMQAMQQRMQMEAQAAQAKIQADTQAAQQKFQMDMQMAQAKIQSDMELQRERLNAEMMAMREKAAAELELEREKNTLRADLEREKSQKDHELRMLELEREFELRQQQLISGQQSNVSSNLPRGK